MLENQKFTRKNAFLPEKKVIFIVKKWLFTQKLDF
jgi:hypothetical protein